MTLTIHHRRNSDGTITVKVGRQSTVLRNDTEVAAFVAGFKTGVVASQKKMTAALRVFDTVLGSTKEIENEQDR